MRLKAVHLEASTPITAHLHFVFPSLHVTPLHLRVRSCCFLSLHVTPPSTFPSLLLFLHRPDLPSTPHSASSRWTVAHVEMSEARPDGRRHRWCSGVDIMQEMNAVARRGGQSAVPFVISSAIGGGKNTSISSSAFLGAVQSAYAPAQVNT